MQLLMDLSKLGVFDSHRVDIISTFEELETVSRNMCFALHSKRVQLLSLQFLFLLYKVASLYSI